MTAWKALGLAHLHCFTQIQRQISSLSCVLFFFFFFSLENVQCFRSPVYSARHCTNHQGGRFELWLSQLPTSGTVPELLFTAGWLCPFLVHVWFPRNQFSMITHQETLPSSPASCWFRSPVSQNRSRARAGRNEWPKTHLLLGRTWHLCEKRWEKREGNCLPFPCNVSELFQWPCRECGGCIECNLACALVFCGQGEGGSLARFQKGMSTRWALSYSYSDAITLQSGHYQDPDFFVWHKRPFKHCCFSILLVAWKRTQKNLIILIIFPLGCCFIPCCSAEQFLYSMLFTIMDL